MPDIRHGSFIYLPVVANLHPYDGPDEDKDRLRG